MAAYPRRNSHHAHRLTRLLFKSYAAQVLTPEAVLLIIHVAHTEDAARYQGPVRFWNSQLNETLGFRHPRKINLARKNAIENGWLHYEREHDRAVGKYWTLIPESVLRCDDAPIEDSHSPSGTGSGTEADFHANTGTGSGTRIGTGSGIPSNPVPVPNPSTSASEQSDGATGKTTKSRKPKPNRTPAYSAAFTQWWSHYPKKVDQPAAWRAFDEAIEQIAEERGLSREQALDWLIERTDAYAMSVTESEPRFIKHPGPWLNADRFNDGLDSEPSATVIYADEPMPTRPGTRARRPVHVPA